MVHLASLFSHGRKYSVFYSTTSITRVIHIDKYILYIETVVLAPLCMKRNRENGDITDHHKRTPTYYIYLHTQWAKI